MGSTKRRYAGPVSALLYVAGRFMAVRIDLCGKRKRAREQAASEQALKLDRAC